MNEIWSEEGKYRRWLEVELAVCEALAARGQIPEDDMQQIRDKAGFDLARIDELDRQLAVRRAHVVGGATRQRFECFGADLGGTGTEPTVGGEEVGGDGDVRRAHKDKACQLWRENGANSERNPPHRFSSLAA